MSAVGGALSDAAGFAAAADLGDPAASTAAPPAAGGSLSWQTKANIAGIAFPHSVKCTIDKHAGQDHRQFFTTPGCGSELDPSKRQPSKCCLCCIRKACIECHLRRLLGVSCPSEAAAMGAASSDSARAVAAGALLTAGWPHIHADTQQSGASGSSTVSLRRLEMALNNLFGPETVAATRALIGSGALAAAASSVAHSAGGASAAPSSDVNSSAAGSGATAAATSVQADDTGATASAGAAAATGGAGAATGGAGAATGGAGAATDGAEYYAPGYTDVAGVFENTAEGMRLALEQLDGAGVSLVDEGAIADGCSSSTYTVHAPVVRGDDGAAHQPRVSARKCARCMTVMLSRATPVLRSRASWLR